MQLGGKHVRERVGKWLLSIMMALRHCPSELLQGCVSQQNKLGFNSARLSAVHLIVNYICNYSQLRSTSWGLGAGAWSARGWRRDSLVFSLVLGRDTHGVTRQTLDSCPDRHLLSTINYLSSVLSSTACGVPLWCSVVIWLCTEWYA